MDEKEDNKEVEYPEIAKDIEEMVREDQELRTEKYLREKDSSRGPEITWDSLKEIDEKHNGKLKQIVKQIGWPTISKVGKTSSYNAWLILQHAAYYPEELEEISFQEYCLKLMKEAPDAEIDAENIKYLEDRIAVLRGNPQKHGTQIKKRPITIPKLGNTR